MRHFAAMVGAILLCAGIAAAQDNSRFEVFGGYSYVRGDGSVIGSGTGFNFNGGTGSIAYNPIPWVGVVAEFSGYRWSGAGALAGDDATVITYLFGPKVSYRIGKFTPFVQSLFGDARLSGDVLCLGEGNCPGSDNAFATALGGGLDWNVSRHVGLRLIQVDYLMTRFSVPGASTSDQQNNVRASAGITFSF